jgi:hydroxypyruvate isomerase
MPRTTVTRRSTLKTLAAASLAAPSLGAWVAAADAPKAKGNIKQSVCRWCYGRVKLEELAVRAKEIGYLSIELIGPDEIQKIKPFGLTCAVMRSASTIPDGLNRKENHDKIVSTLQADIEFASAEGIPNVLCMSGNRRSMANDVGLAHCAEGLKRVLKLAEDKKVTVLMEGLNSKVNHKDYMYDHTA